MPKLLLLGALVLGLGACKVASAQSDKPFASGGPVDIGSRLELFVDNLLLDRLDGVKLKLHEPFNAGEVMKFDKPWEGAFCGYITVIQDGGLFRMYYRGLPVAGRNEGSKTYVCYAESRDGIHWTKPDLGLFEVAGTRQNNVVLTEFPFTHNFSPFLDTRPGVPANERFKALAGSAKTKLVAFASEDGLHWRKLRDEPVLKEGLFDSQNVAFWSESEQCYVAYVRTWTGGGIYKGVRTVSRATSTNFLDWSPIAPMNFGGTPTEHLYTSQTHPYCRAPHIYIATPMRFMPGRKVLTDEQAAKLGVVKGYASDCAEAVFMSSRGGTNYTRAFMEAFIRPGLDLGNWASRAGLTALGVVPTGPGELSIYKQANYAQPSQYLVRYTLRTDGFISVNAPYAGGEFTTKLLKFSGRELVLNFSTGAAGGVKVELQDEAGQPLPGYTLADAVETIGDDIERPVQWAKGGDLAELAGKAVRLRFVMKDADLYSLRFRP